jgi:hypothetical protein
MPSLARSVIQLRDVLPVPEDAAFRRRHQTHDDLGQGGLTAAVGSGEHDQAVVRDHKIDIFQDFGIPFRAPNDIRDILKFKHGFLPPFDRNHHIISDAGFTIHNVRRAARIIGRAGTNHLDA